MGQYLLDIMLRAIGGECGMRIASVAERYLERTRGVHLERCLKTSKKTMKWLRLWIGMPTVFCICN